jgi:hypothetical protein
VSALEETDRFPWRKRQFIELPESATTRQWRYCPKADRRDLYPARFDSKRS